MKVLGRYKRIELPFSIENNFMVINILLDNILPSFIIDTGAENTILLEKDNDRYAAGRLPPHL